MKQTNNYRNQRLPFATIKKATHGDEAALMAVIDHYSSYIDRCATRYAKGVGMYVDEDVRQYAIERLLIAITTMYDITRLS